MNGTINQIKFLMYETPTEKVAVEGFIKNETLWITQKTMAKIFGVEQSAIAKHLKNIFDCGELLQDSVYSKMEYTATDGKTYKVQFYNLDAVISVGYRVNSIKATNFRIRATKIIKEYMQKGFVLDDERLKLGEKTFGKDYFRELLERVRSIRASERRIWQQITDIFQECSIDYDKDSTITNDFFAMVQNKFHFAITGSTAAEIIYNSADAEKENMGLTTWKYAPDGRILKSDTTIAKNYLSENEIRRLERTVTGYFDYVEDLIENEHVFTMEDFAKSINEFLSFRKFDILEGKGKISSEQAKEKAHAEYDKFNKKQLIVSDFDKLVEKIRDNKD